MVSVCLSAGVGVGSLLCLFCRAGSWGSSAIRFLHPSPCLSLLPTFHLLWGSCFVVERSNALLCNYAGHATDSLGSSVSVRLCKDQTERGEDGRDEKVGGKGDL